MATNKITTLASVLLIPFLSVVCYANPIVIGPPSAGKFALSTNLGLVIDFAADLVALFVGFLLIKNIKVVVTWKFLPYFLMVFLGGLIIDVMAILSIQVFSFMLPMENVTILVLFLVAGLFLYLFNSWLSEKVFDLDITEKAVIGIVMAVLTNPVIGFILAG
jgi:hypothetical protein